jgi:hypothetical protein
LNATAFSVLPWLIMLHFGLKLRPALKAMKPTIRQVEEALGVKAQDWDCVDPKELIDVIYRLSIEADNTVSKQSNNVHLLPGQKLTGKRRK